MLARGHLLIEDILASANPRWRRRWPPRSGPHSRISSRATSSPPMFWVRRSRRAHGVVPLHAARFQFRNAGRDQPRAPKTRRVARSVESGGLAGRPHAGCRILFVIASRILSSKSAPIRCRNRSRPPMAIELGYPTRRGGDLLVSGDRRARLEIAPATDAATPPGSAVRKFMLPRAARLRAGADRRILRPGRHGGGKPGAPRLSRGSASCRRRSSAWR
jgi:hypothetical protein